MVENHDGPSDTLLQTGNNKSYKHFFDLQMPSCHNMRHAASYFQLER